MGRENRAIPPARVIRMESTEAKMGRLMKKLVNTSASQSERGCPWGSPLDLFRFLRRSFRRKRGVLSLTVACGKRDRLFGPGEHPPGEGSGVTQGKDTQRYVANPGRPGRVEHLGFA